MLTNLLGISPLRGPISLPAPVIFGHRSSVNTHDLTEEPMTVTHPIDTVTERPGHARSRSCQCWFYLNHPIQFVCVTGVVVAFDDYERLWVFTIDATCRKPEKVKVKGTISTFRSVRQIALECIEIIPDTNSELRFRTQCTQLFADVLSKP